MKTVEVKVRPIPTSSDKSSEKTLKGASRIYVNRENLLELTGTAQENGKPCIIEKAIEGGHVIRREASLWVAADTRLSRAVVQMSKAFQDACDFKLGDQVKICYAGGTTIPEAEEVTLEDVTVDQPGITEESLVFWEWSITGNLMGLDDVFPGLGIKRIPGEGTHRNFKIDTVNGSRDNIARFVPRSTKVHIRTAQQSENTAIPRPASIQLDMIPGLEHQIQELNELFLNWNAPFHIPCQRESCGIVIHGGHGTGKTMLLNRICETGWGTVHRVQPTEKLSSITEIFQRARENQPSIVVMDKFDKLIEKDRSNRNAVIQTIGEFLDKLAADAAANDECPKLVVIAACLDYLTDMPQELKDMGRFEEHINLPLPDANRRRAILSSFGVALPLDTRASILTNLAERTHAFNGKDLKRLAQKTAQIRLVRLYEMERSGKKTLPEDTDHSEEAFQQAMQKIRPSAMQDINLKPPPTHWDDIGGQEEVKKSLQQAIILATEPKENLLAYIANPPKGFLLYGPPGCSKTMAAQALATESDLNFFAVKGAELLNMYVGESERQIRQLFQRAREAAPSIIFFDEIDSIGGQRSGFGSTTSGSSSSGLNVLTTLLNEMQGFERTQGVLVLAATNRPQALDPALLRPGRFDKLIYVGPPNSGARETIIRKYLSTKKATSDVDIDEITRETDGFSGAETVGICEKAGLTAFWRDHGKQDGPGITMEDFRQEIRATPRMITKEMLNSYESWARKFLKGDGGFGLFS